MSAVKLKNTVLGKGIPKICVPITDKNIVGIEHSLKAMRDAEFDVIEWRADKFDALTALCTGIGSVNYPETVRESDKKAQTLKSADMSVNDIPESFKSELKKASEMIRTAFPDKAVIFTIRTSRDMEDFEISDEAYSSINCLAADMQLADIIDIEFSRGNELVKELNAKIHASGLKTIVSKHLRDSTPESLEIVDTLCKMQQTGADIVKFAAMPQSERDVLKLMDATLIMKEEHNDTPVISMSMSSLGVLSRISGALTGSCLTFGTVGAASAPGQLECGRLHDILCALQ